MYEKIFSQVEAVYSICMPVYNQEDIIQRVLQGIVSCTSDFYEILMVCDCCSDETEKVIRDWIETIYSEKLTRIVLFVTTHPQFETKADNMCFKHSKGKYIIEIQADMVMTQTGYNLEIQKPFKKLDNVIAVSGNFCSDRYDGNGRGRIAAWMEPVGNVRKGVFYVNETCNRGPLMIDREKLVAMNYLDEINYFQDNSDHDLMARAYDEHRWICGYVYIEFLVEKEWGSTRKVSDQKNIDAFALRKTQVNERRCLEIFNRHPVRQVEEIVI
jgi:glycosyltransferase involved in cell wall biosynthesis